MTTTTTSLLEQLRESIRTMQQREGISPESLVVGYDVMGHLMVHHAWPRSMSVDMHNQTLMGLPLHVSR